MTTGRERDSAGVTRLFLAYTLVRLAMLAAIAGLLVLARVPPIVAILVAIVVALPLSLVAFRGLRTRLESAVADVAARRAAQREALRSQLRGSDQVEGGELAEPEPDGGEGGPGQQGDAGLPQHMHQPPPGDPGEHPPHR